MRLFMVAAIALSLTALFVSPAGTRSPSAAPCDVGPADERCQADRVRRQREIYGLPAIEQLQRGGVQVRRTFFVDAHGRDVGVLSFTRRPGQMPRVTYQAPRHRGFEPAAAEVPLALWRQVLERSREFERSSPLPPPDAICLDSWRFLVEAGDPPGVGGKSPPRRRAVSMCPRPEFILWLADQAAALIAPCNRLDPAFDIAIDRLATCLWLEGDRAVAAEVSNAVHPLLWLRLPDEIDAVSDAFAADASLDWQGQRVSGRDAVIERWRRGIAELHGADFYPVRIRGTHADRAELLGSLDHAAPDEGAVAYRTPVTMIWMRGADGRLRIVRVAVGRSGPLEDRSAPSGDTGDSRLRQVIGSVYTATTEGRKYTPN